MIKIDKSKCHLCCKKLKLIETITNKCCYCLNVFCLSHKVPFIHNNLNVSSGHICEEYIKKDNEIRTTKLNEKKENYKINKI